MSMEITNNYSSYTAGYAGAAKKKDVLDGTSTNQVKSRHFTIQ